MKAFGPDRIWGKASCYVNMNGRLVAFSVGGYIRGVNKSKKALTVLVLCGKDDVELWTNH